MDNDIKKKKTTNSTKKKSTTIKTVKKGNTSNKNFKNVENVEKSSNKNTKNKINKKSIDKTSIILLMVFIALCVLVCVLFGLVLHKNKEMSKNPTASIVIPVIKKDNKMTFSLDLYSMKENEEYYFKVTNYRGDNVNDFDINYSIYVKNDTDAKIELYRVGNEKVNLMDNSVDNEIKDLKLYKNEKEDIYFKVVVSNLKNVKKKELASFMILS